MWQRYQGPLLVAAFVILCVVIAFGMLGKWRKEEPGDLGWSSVQPCPGEWAGSAYDSCVHSTLVWLLLHVLF